MTSPVECFITYKTATVTFVMFTFIIIIYYILNGRRKSLTELNLLQLDSITISFSFSLVILKRAPSSVQAFGNPLLPWIPSEFSGCLTISKSCQKAQSYLHTLIRCSVSCLPLSFVFFFVRGSAFLFPPILILPIVANLTSQMEPRQTAPLTAPD